MRQLHLFFACFTTFYSLSLNAQTGCPGCVVSLPPGLPADTLLLQNLPDGEAGTYYNHDISFRMPKTTRRDVTAIAFNKETEVVEAVNQYSLKDGKVIAFNGRETPTRGRELTIFEQLIGTVGRGTMMPNQDEGVPGSRPGDRR